MAQRPSSIDEFATKVKELYASDPAKVRFVLKYKHHEGTMTLRATNDELVRASPPRPRARRAARAKASAAERPARTFSTAKPPRAVAHLQDGPGRRVPTTRGAPALAHGRHVRQRRRGAHRRVRGAGGRRGRGGGAATRRREKTQRQEEVGFFGPRRRAALSRWTAPFVTGLGSTCDRVARRGAPSAKRRVGGTFAGPSDGVAARVL